MGTPERRKGLEGLEGKAAAVTCAGDGALAHAVAAALAHAGAATTLLGRERPGAGVPAGCAFIAVDLLDPEACARAIAAAQGAAPTIDGHPGRRLDVLCNLAAAELSPGRQLHEIDEANWDRAVAETVRTALLASRFAVPLMRASGGGSIVNLSHSAALVGVPGTSLLAATAGTLLNMTRAMAVNTAAAGIRVNCVCLGSTSVPVVPSQLEAHRKQPVPPAEVAPLFVFLAGEGARHVNGQIIPADDGMTAWR